MLQKPIQSPLGIFNIFQEGFALLMRNFGTFIMIALVFELISFALSAMIVGLPGQAVPIEPDAQTLLKNLAPTPKDMVAFAVSIIVSALSLAYITMAAFDVRNNEPINFSNYLTHGLRYLAPVVATILIIVGLLFLPFVVAVSLMTSSPVLSSVISMFSIYWSFFVLTAFSVVTPIILMEQKGLSSMARSAQLTAGYRFPIALLYMLLALGVAFYLITVRSVLSVVFGSSQPENTVVSLPELLGMQAFMSLPIAYMTIVFVVLYVRLKELKH